MYICLSRRNDALGTFDFVKDLEKLKKDSLASYEQIAIGVEREKLLLKKVPLDASVHEDFSYQRQDFIANAIVLQYTVSTKVALQSTGNGDCLFNSFSTGLVGDESRAVEFRYRCCIEMVTNKSRLLRPKLFRALEPITPNYDTDCLNCARKGDYSSMWNIVTLAYLLKVKVICPAVNGSDNYSFINNKRTRGQRHLHRSEGR